MADTELQILQKLRNLHVTRDNKMVKFERSLKSLSNEQKDELILTYASICSALTSELSKQKIDALKNQKRKPIPVE